MLRLKFSKQKTNKEIYESFDDYLPDDSLFSDDDPETYKLKKALQLLPQSERTIMIMLAELGSQAEVARRLEISPGTMCRKIASIRHKLEEILDTL